MNQPSAALQRVDMLASYLASDPDNARLLSDYFDALIHAGQLDKAGQTLAHALAHWPDDPVFLFRRSVLALATQQYPEAQAVLEALIERGITFPGVICNLAQALFRQARYADVIARLHQYPETCTEIVYAQVLLIRSLHQLGEISAATAEARALLARQPESPEALSLLALLLADGNHFAEAQPYAEQAIAREPQAAEALVALGTIALNAGDNERSLACYEQVLSTQPREGRSLLGRGILRLQGMDFERAALDLEGALYAYPNHAGTAVALAWCYFLQEDIKSAEACFRQAVTSSRSFAEAHGGLAVIAAFKKDVQQAKQHIERARRLNPQVLSIHLAEAMLNGEDFSTGQFARKAMKLLDGLQLPTAQLPVSQRLYLTLLQRGQGDALH